MKLLAVVVFCALISSQYFASASKILAILPFPVRSHYSPFEPLFKRLSENGHEVTVISNFPQRVKIPNFVDVDVSASLTHMLGGGQPLPVVDDITVLKNAEFLLKHVGPDLCRNVLSHPEVGRIIEAGASFDLIISEIFITDCFLGFIHKFGSSYIGVTTSVPMPWLPEALANPDNPSYIPNFFSRSSVRMNYLERFSNAFHLLALKIGYKIYADTAGYDVANEFFGPGLPSLDELRSKVGLVLVNSHHAVTAPRALAPGVKEVGGIHIPASGPAELPKDLKEYLDSASQGVVYFSMGSLLNSSTFPEKNMAVFRRVFGELTQRVLWRCDGRKMPQLPDNVKCLDWIPQLAVLCHPNVRVYIGHGGLLGTQEAVYCGVPILGMPLFGDQFLNVANIEDRGFALRTEYHYPSYEEFSDKLRQLLTNPSYSERAKEASRRFRDRPQAPLEEAVFWVEYVLRHGPEALRTAASELAWYQYLLLDVVAGVFIVLLLVLWILWRLLAAIFPGRKHRVENLKRKKN